MSACLVIIVFSTVLMGSISYILVRNHLISAHTEEMTRTADIVANIATDLLGDYNTSYNSFYNLNINVIANKSDTSIIICDYKGNIITKSDNYRVSEKQIDLSPFDEFEEGEKQIKKGVLDKAFSKRTITVSAPVVYRGRLFGTVLVTVLASTVYRKSEAVLGIFALITIFAIVASVLLSYLLSRRITKPIKALSVASREIAKGSFGKRVFLNSSIPEMQELEASFNSMAQELETQITRRTDFIANVSHDLRTPMTTICGFVEAVLDGTVSEKEREGYLKIVLSETKRLSEFVKKLLAVATYDNGTPVIEKTEFDLNEMVRDVLLSLEKNITEKELKVEFTYDSDISEVFAGKAEIHSVLQNLVENAVKFSDLGGEVSVEIKHSGKKTVTSVSNTGAEISDTDKKYIFDRFYKADRSRTDKKSGFGLGLYIVKSILIAHKEDIKVVSKNGKTTFMFTLPTA